MAKARQEVYLGRSIATEVRALAAASDRSASGQVVYLCKLAMRAPTPAPVATMGIQLDDQDGRVSVWAPPEFFAQIEDRTSRAGYHSGESRSEAYRALILQGLAIDRASREQVERIFGTRPQEVPA